MKFGYGHFHPKELPKLLPQSAANAPGHVFYQLRGDGHLLFYNVSDCGIVYGSFQRVLAGVGGKMQFQINHKLLPHSLLLGENAMVAAQLYIPQLYNHIRV